MNDFNIIIESTAKSDLRGILIYIAEPLKEPKTAKQIHDSVKERIMALEQMPLQCPLVRDVSFAARGLRRLQIGNYSAFYSVDEFHKEVHILRVLYSRREWRNLI